MKVLFVHNVGVWGGSLRSMFETIRALSNANKGIEIHLIMPECESAVRFEPFANVYCFKAIPQFDSTEYGQYIGFRKLVLLREILAKRSFKREFVKFRKKHDKFDIVHFNEIVSFNAVSEIFVKSYPKAKIISHVRSLQRSKGPKRFILRQLQNNADALIAIDDCVKKTLHHSLYSKTHIIPNIFVRDSKNVNKPEEEETSLKVLYIGGLGWEKGPDFALEAAKLSKLKGLNCEFTFAGIKEDNLTVTKKALNFILGLLGIRRRFTLDFVNSYIRQNELDEIVHLEKFRSDISDLLSRHDLLIFPSRLNAPGRPSIEAMSYSLPSIIFCNFGSNLIVKEGDTGYNIPNQDVRRLIEKIDYLSSNRHILRQMNKSCYDYYHSFFNQRNHLQKVEKIYYELLN